MRLIDADALIERMVQIPLRQLNTKTFGEALDSIPTIGGWISVKDRMPPNDDTKVLTYGDPVTHWMPLPEPPEEVSGDD